MVTHVAIETTSIPLPKGYNAALPAHEAQLLKIITEKMGPGWQIEGTDSATNVAHLSRRSNTLNVTQDADDKALAKQIDLPLGTKEADGPRIAAKQAEIYPGYFLTVFKPHIGKAILERKTEAELRCREAVANALRCKPWDVQVQQRKDGGYALQLPGTYNHTKAEQDKLQAVAESVVGKFGWYVTIDPQTLVAQIKPSEPPTFPAVVPFPASKIKPVADWGPKGDKERFTVMLGEGLGNPGEKNTPVIMSLDDSTALLTVGLPGSGKSVAVRAMLVQLAIKGFRIAVLDTPAKKTDYQWIKPYVQDHWWGCDDEGTSCAEALTVATLLDEEGKRLGALLNEHRVAKWQDLPPEVKAANPPIIVVADELANLLNKPKVPAGLPKEAKELPEFVRMAQDFLEAKLLTTKLNALVAVHRAAGMREIYLSQRPGEKEGFPSSLKTLMPHRLQLGASPSEADLQLAFRDPKRIPRMPVNIAGDPVASRGAGMVHLDGSDPQVIKGFFAKDEVFDELLAKYLGKGDPSDARVRPTAEQITCCVPRVDGGSDDIDDEGPSPMIAGETLPSGKPLSSLDPKFGRVATVYDENGKPLKGAALAAAQSKQIGQQTGHAVLCPDGCGQPIASDGSCGCA